VQEIDLEVTLQLTQVLGVAEDARGEGRHSGLNPDRVIEAAGTLRRIVHRLSGIASGRLALQQVALPTDLQAARAACDTALRHHLQSWLAVPLEAEPGPDRRHILEVAAHFTPDDLAAPLAALQERLSAASVEELAAWPAARSLLLAEMESYRRLVGLVGELDQHFVEIPAPAPR
jgi:hypothetical protein